MTDAPDRDRTSNADRDAIHRIDYRRWNRGMLELSQALWELPRRPGARGHSSLDLGLDRLRRDQPTLAMMYRVVDAFEYRPTAAEVERIGRELFRMKYTLYLICRDHRRMRREQAEADRSQTPRLRRGPRAGS